MADDNGTQTGETGTQDGGTGTGTGTGTTGATGTDETGTTGTTGTEKATETATVSKAEFDALLERMKAADRRATKAETDKKALEDAGKTDAEKVTARNAELETELAKTRSDVRRTKLQNAFLSDGTQWNNSADAFELLLANHGDGVEVGTDGKVTGMDVAIKALAKTRAYLVKADGSTEATGSEHNGNRKGSTKENEAAARIERSRRFPAAFNGTVL